MLNRILSHDLPRSRWLSAALLVVLVGLALAPFLFPGAKSMSVVAKILVFILLVASYDLLLGYTGIVSFAHTMFFGIGAYGIAIASDKLGAGWGAVGLGLAGAIAVSVLLSLLIGLFSLRVKAIFFAMITLAVASAFMTLASQLSDFTGGEDGLTFRSPEWLSPGFEPFETEVLGLLIDGKAITYWLLFAVVLALFLLILRIVNSPFGRVLQAIRENDFRAEAIGYRTVVYRTLSNVLAALFATVAGALLALWLRYVGPDTTLSFEIMLDILLIVVIGGMGTLYGAVIGSVLFVLAQNYLQDLLRIGAGAFEGVPVLQSVVAPDRWLLWLGVLFVLSVYHFPTGVVGRLRARAVDEGDAMNGCTSNYRVCEGREIHYTEWGAGHAEVVVAWHGLARTGRDMDAIAAHLATRWRVICPDTLGRDLSQWSPEPGAEYCLAFYEKLAVSLLDQLGIAQCLWLGTSMGGAIGLKAAAGRYAGASGAWCSTTSALNSPSRRCSASAATPAARRRSRPWPSWRPSSAPSTRPTAGCPTRSGASSPRPRCAACPTAASRRTTTRRWCGSSPTTPTTTCSGTPGMRSSCRCCACAVNPPTCFCPRRPRRCARAARAPSSSPSPAAATRRR